MPQCFVYFCLIGYFLHTRAIEAFLKKNFFRNPIFFEISGIIQYPYFQLTSLFRLKSPTIYDASSKNFFKTLPVLF